MWASSRFCDPMSAASSSRDGGMELITVTLACRNGEGDKLLSSLKCQPKYCLAASSQAYQNIDNKEPGRF